MRICSAVLLSGLALASLCASGARALDGVTHPAARLPPEVFTSGKDALRSGVKNYNAGDKVGAVKALEYAADQGYSLALWKLGRMYADGDGIPQDDLKAFEYFSRIADDNADEAPDSPRAGVVASAFVSIGSYFLDGIKNSYVRPNPERAAEMFGYAASYFGDPTAQYSLARLYLDGNGIERDARQAARWFNLAAEKGHHPAQAVLGTLLIKGEEGVPKQRARGLMWLTMAKEGADPKRDGWIMKLYADAFNDSNESDRHTALAFLEQFQAKRR